MRKNSIGVTLALALTLGAASVATAQGTTSGPERSRPAQDSSSVRRGPGDHGGRRDAMLLRGITLSSDQQGKIAALRATERSRMDSLRTRAGEARAGGRGDAASARAAGAPRVVPGVRGDTAGRGARWARMEKQREQHIADLRAILTPDQRTQFDRNVAELKARRAAGGSMDRGRAERGRGDSTGWRPQAERQSP